MPPGELSSRAAFQVSCESCRFHGVAKRDGRLVVRQIYTKFPVDAAGSDQFLRNEFVIPPTSETKLPDCPQIASSLKQSSITTA